MQDEFSEIEIIDPPMEKISASIREQKCSYCVYYGNRKKNRYSNIYCLDSSRFIFLKAVEISINFDWNSKPYQYVPDEERYIHANIVKLFEKEFIATQAPMENTMGDFFDMIWQEKTKVIISLTDVEEGGIIKMQKFWAEKPLLVDHFEITVLSETVNKNICVRKLSIKNYCCNDSIEVHQIHYTGWPDSGVPDGDLEKILEMQNACLGRPVVHCSAGVGRTGVYMVFAAIYGKKNVNIKETVLEARRQRNGAVQNKAQYEFLLKVTF